MQTPSTIRKKKGQGKITVLTSYDYWTTLILNEAGIDMIIVGDSLGMVMLGYKNTLPVTMDEMIHHTKAVVRGNRDALIVGDMPFMSDIDALWNAGRFIKEGGAHAIKLEGGSKIKDIVRGCVDNGIPVMGHIGLTPQDVLCCGYKRQSDKDKLLEDALAIQESGAFCIVLECVTPEIAKEVTEKIVIPTIGIGSGPHCDGQVLVTHDLLGLVPSLTPRFVKPYARLKEAAVNAITRWKKDI